ncbi:MAG TPA: hypothetical protein VIE67_09185 [Rudaea sp.]|jgi:hypothetical protein|uniref:hypothetical protein n=1 Tax=Rudaea sp. TaxID=2136325 RepID=UPI002F94CAC1
MNFRMLVPTIALFAFSASANATVEIWNWAVVTKDADNLIAGYGASIFQIEGAKRSGPLHLQGNISGKLNFTIDGVHVRGTLTPENYHSKSIEMEGEITREKTSGEFQCLETVRMTNGIHYVVLDRAPKTCES